MKIFWIENGEILGGAELFSLDILEHWAKNPHATEPWEIVLLHSGKNEKFSEQLKKISAISSDFFSLSPIVFPIPPLKPVGIRTLFLFFSSFFALQKLVNKEKPNVVFSNTVRGFLLQFFLSHPQKIFFAHDFTFPRVFLKFSNHFFAKILACSHAIKKFLVENGVQETKIAVLENGVDARKFSSFVPPKTLNRIGVVGRLVPWKGQKTVLEAAKILLPKNPEMEFFFFGESDSKHKAFQTELLHMRENIPEKNRIHFEGFVPVEKALEKIDVLVHAAEENEPFGRTPLEGAMAKKPLLISNCGTPAEIFSEHHATFFEKGSAISCSNALKIMQIEQEKTLQKSEDAYEYVIKNFSLSSVAETMKKVLKI